MLRNLVKSKSDKRNYKVLTLPNKLQCLLISDRDTDKSAASLDVKVGQINDPIERPGLAHFLEHMLFLGTKKYPNQNDYSSYITSNSGSNNAYTALCNTNYFFDCSNQAFFGGLERFAQFFINPLFTESCTEREVNAVHSEHEKNLNSDLWRKMQLFRSSSLPNHQYNKFGTGNRATLSHPTIREDLLSFYQQYYSSNLMKLVIYGKEEVDRLEEWAHSLFFPIPNKDVIIPNITEPAFNKEILGNFWKVYPIKDKDYLEFVWVLDNLDQYYQNNPARYISELVGHEGKNSLLSFLIDEGLALDLRSGYSTEINLFTKFTISIHLTKKGLMKYIEVCRIVFQYFKMMREEGVQQWIFDELKKILKIKFDFKDKEPAMTYVTNLSDAMQHYPIEDIIHLNYMMEEYKSDLIQEIINSMDISRLRVYLISKSVESECNQKESWYQTPYCCHPFTDDFKKIFYEPKIKQSQRGNILGLPEKNIFIPTNFTLAERGRNPSQFPQKIYQTDNLEVWFKHDSTFHQPKACIYLKLYCNDLGFGTQIESYILLDIWVRLFNESLREMLYLASSAAVICNIDMDSEGPEIFISGFNDSMEKIIVELFIKMKAFDPSTLEEYFHNTHEKMLKNIKNFYKNQPYEQGINFQNALMKKGGDNCHPDEEIRVLEKIKFEDLLYFHINWFKTMRSEALFLGNLTQTTTYELGKKIEGMVSSLRENSNCLRKDLIPEVRVVNIPAGTTWFYEHLVNNIDGNKESNSAIISLFQYDKETPYVRMMMSILANYLKDPCFDKLRTEEQLGYIVTGFNAEMRGILNYMIIVQSNIHGPQYLSQRILSFIDYMRPKIKNLSEEEFQKYVESVRIKVAQKDLSIRQETSRYWYEVSTHRYIFNRKEVNLAQLAKAKKQDLIWIFEELFYKNRRLLETHIVSQDHREENILIKRERMEIERNLHQIVSPEWFKRRLSLYPDYNSMFQMITCEY